MRFLELLFGGPVTAYDSHRPARPLQRWLHMLERTSCWRTLTLGSMGFVALSACASNAGHDAERPEALTALQLADGTEIASQSLSCVYRQDIGSSDTLSLQLQYLSAPGRVAFAAYIDDPAPATPFVATPRGVRRFDFEAFQGSAGFESQLSDAEITVHLDALPLPSSLSDGQAVPLHGRLEIASFSMAGSSFEDGSVVAPLELAPATVAIDCDATFQESQVFD